jgi:hypothetical protein
MLCLLSSLDYRQQTQLNALQERMLTADLSGANRFSSAAVGVEAIAPPPAHPSQHDVFRGAEAIAPLPQHDVSGSIPQAGLQLRGAEAIAPLSHPGVSDTLPWHARPHRGAEAIAPSLQQIPSSRTTQPGTQSDGVTLQDLRSLPGLAAQAHTLAGSVDVSKTGTLPPSKLLKRGWSHKGGDSVPTVPTPWPHDFVLGHGAQRSLSYEDLDIYQWL